MPGNPLGSAVPLDQRSSPWLPLISLMDEDMTSAPVLLFSWRTRLLHPLYPYLEYVVCVRVCVK